MLSSSAADSANGKNTSDFRMHLALDRSIEEDRIDGLLDALTRRAGEMGPVVSQDRDTTTVTLATDAERTTASQAVATAVSAVSEALVEVGLPQFFVHRIELYIDVELAA